MRQALQRPSRQRVSQGRPLPAPTGGWDANSPLGDMKPDRAILLDNFFPTAQGVELRGGYWPYATLGGSGAVETLMPYSAPNPANDRFFAVRGGTIYNITSGATPVATTVTGLGNSRLQFVNMATPGEQFLWACNGQNAPNLFDGSSWSVPAITGITSSQIANVAMHKKRLWFALTNSLDAAYLPVESIQGAAVLFPLGSVFNQGGNLVAIGSWSRDAGTGGLDDLAVFVSSRGQVAIYEGTDPNSASDWNLVGVFDLGPPLGRRCMLKVANDLALITQEGVLPLSQALQRERSTLSEVALTTNVRNAMSRHAQLYGRNFGWQLATHPVANMAILNVPLAENGLQHQFVMNTITGAWCRFTGQNASCWASYQDKLFFGGSDGTVYQADAADVDHSGSLIADMRLAFNNFRLPGRVKRFGLVRPMVTQDREIIPALGMDVDLTDKAVLAAVSGQAGTQTSQWDLVNWDEFAWAPDTTSQAEWADAGAVGETMSLKMRAAVYGPGNFGSSILYQVNGFQVTFEAGDGLL